VHFAVLRSVCMWRKERPLLKKRVELKVMNDKIMSSRLLDLILEKKANNHVGSRGVDCCWMPYVHA
jgi:hypothetical protein